MPESIDTPESVETLSGCDLVSILFSSEEHTFSGHVVDFFFMILWLDSRKGCCKSSIALSVIPKRYANVFTSYLTYLNDTTAGHCQSVAASLGKNAKTNLYTSLWDNLRPQFLHWIFSAPYDGTLQSTAKISHYKTETSNSYKQTSHYAWN